MPLELAKNGRLRLSVRVKPKASPQGLEGIRDGRLLIRISAPAVDGKANFALVAYLAKVLKIKKTEVLLLSGEKSRNKVLEISGIEPGLARQKLGLPESE